MFKFFSSSLRHLASSLLAPSPPTNLPFLFSSYLTLALSSPRCPFLRLSFYLNLSDRHCFLFSPLLSGYNGFPDIRFSRETTRLMNWPDGERYTCPLQSLVVSSLTSRIHSCLFSDWRYTVSSKCFDAQAPSISPRNLCALVTLAAFSLVFTATDIAFYKLLSH